MLLEAILLMVGAGGTMAVGIPIAVRLARAGLVHPAGEASGTGASRAGGLTAGFTPLDLGPDPMQWPSATPWPSSKLPVPDWPSKSWNDEHFGRHWQQAGGEASPEARAAPSPAQRQATLEAERRSQQQQAQAARQAQHREAQQAAKQAAQQATQRRQAEQQRRREAARHELEQRQAARQQQAQREAPAQAPPAGSPPAGAPPDRAELLALIDRVGLAGTVKAIMQRTGWDFRTSAQYLARVRSGR